MGIFEISFVILVVIVLLFGFLIVKFEREKAKLIEKNNLIEKENISLNEKLNNFKNIINEKEEIINSQNKKIEKLNQELIEDKQTIEQLSTKLKINEKNMQEKLEFLEKADERLKESFKNLASSILENSAKKFNETSQKELNLILNPLQKELSEFKKKIELTYEKELENFAGLKNELKHLKELNDKLSKDAQNLTKALKGDKKAQGIWGEVILERVLELSGLREGYEYKKEVLLKDEFENSFRPDIIVYLPNNREVIIDAKTSLNAYDSFINAQNEEEKNYFLKEHIQNIKNHINKLSEKKYENLKGVNSLDFIFMFIPIENALMVALEKDNTLFEYAFKKKIILVSPTTLLVSLRAIESSWRYEKQAKNIAEVIKMAESLYDKVRGFVDDFVKIEKALKDLQKNYDNAKNKLVDGRGNIIRQLQNLKEKAGIKPKKEINSEFVDIAMIES